MKWLTQDLEMNHCVAHSSTSSQRQTTSVLADEKTLYGPSIARLLNYCYYRALTQTKIAARPSGTV